MSLSLIKKSQIKTKELTVANASSINERIRLPLGSRLIGISASSGQSAAHGPVHVRAIVGDREGNGTIPLIDEDFSFDGNLNHPVGFIAPSDMVMGENISSEIIISLTNQTGFSVHINFTWWFEE